MVPACDMAVRIKCNSPRIRGDGPRTHDETPQRIQFSPYSRGWSPRPPRHRVTACHSPRIRGDGPRIQCRRALLDSFSPYSRGWSRTSRYLRSASSILPVFAGMVPHEDLARIVASYSPRIRGDGPGGYCPVQVSRSFSPYSRGWSRWESCCWS